MKYVLYILYKVINVWYIDNNEKIMVFINMMYINKDK